LKGGSDGGDNDRSGDDDCDDDSSGDDDGDDYNSDSVRWSVFVLTYHYSTGLPLFGDSCLRIPRM
jgi:hypothetical protein